MFPSVKTRFSAAARRGLDIAIEFATLGEYRLPQEAGPTAGPAIRAASATAAGAAAGGVRRRTTRAPLDTRMPSVTAGGIPVRARAIHLRPASAAARRLQPGAPPLRISSHSGVRALAFSAHEPRPLRGGRKRAGAAKPGPQPCLVGDAQVVRGMDS
jgi:hypothetical protein